VTGELSVCIVQLSVSILVKFYPITPVCANFVFRNRRFAQGVVDGHANRSGMISTIGTGQKKLSGHQQNQRLKRAYPGLQDLLRNRFWMRKIRRNYPKWMR